MNFFEKQKNGGLVESKEIQKTNEVVKLQKLVDSHKTKMLNKFCPLAKCNCRQDCVHFVAGRVIDFDDFVMEQYSRCKLWAK